MFILRNRIGFKYPVYETPNEGTPTPVTPPPAAAPVPSAETDPLKTPEANSEDSSPKGLLSEDPSADPNGTSEPLTLTDFTIPEGFEIPEELGNSFLEVLAESDPKQRGQKLLDMYAEVQKQSVQQGIELWDKTVKDWQDQVRADPEFGGENLAKNLAAIKGGLKAAGATKETFEALSLTGAENNPEILKLLLKLTKGFREGGHVDGQTVRAPLSREELAAKMYPTMAGQKGA